MNFLQLYILGIRTVSDAIGQSVCSECGLFNPVITADQMLI